MRSILYYDDYDYDIEDYFSEDEEEYVREIAVVDTAGHHRGTQEMEAPG